MLECPEGGKFIGNEVLTVMRVRSHRRERSEHLPCGYSLLIYPGCHLRRLSGTGLERKSPHNQSTRHRRFDIAAYIVLRDGTHNSRTRMTQRNSYTAWAGSRRLNWVPSETVPNIGWSRYQTTGSHQVPASCLLNRCHTVRGGLTQSHTSEMNPPQGETQGKQR